jgi:hypothetical protein
VSHQLDPVAFVKLESAVVVTPSATGIVSVLSAVVPPLSSWLTVSEIDVSVGTVASVVISSAVPSAAFVAVVSDPLVSNGIFMR